MKLRNSDLLAVTALVTLIFIGAAPSYSQITINLPKLPKIFRERPANPAAPVQPTASSSTDSRMNEPAPSREEQRPTRTPDCEIDGRTSYHLMEIEKVKKEAESYVPGQRAYFVGMLSHGKNEYMEAALYKSSRDRLFAKQSEGGPKCLTPALDELAAIARKKLPSYMGPVGYTNGTLAEKKLLTSAISDINLAKIHGIGMLQPNWVIAKDNFNFPTARYKHGMIIAKYPQVEFCWVFYVNIVQDYAGGGRYGASYANYIGRVVSGCPAGK